MAARGAPFRDVIRLALRDYLHEWRMSSCFVLALAAVLAPMLVLFGLKFGVVSSMVDVLVEDPRNRELRPLGSGRFDAAWFERLAARPDVAFVVPRTRTIAATMDLVNPDASRSRIVSVEMIPSAAGDPLLRQNTPAPARVDAVVLSHRAAQKLSVGAGDEITGSLRRVYGGKRERVELRLSVAAVAAADAFAREGAFVTLELLAAAEDFRDGRAVPALGWSGDAVQGERTFSGFRLFARSIDDVAALDDELSGQGIDVRTRRADIAIVQSIDRNLSIVYWVIAMVATIGYALSLGASLWANVDRKQRELSVLRLVGFHTGGIVWFPILQALFTAVAGLALAVSIYLAVENALNQLFVASVRFGDAICRLLPIHFAVAIVLTLSTAVLASALGGLRAARIEPSEGLRDI